MRTIVSLAIWITGLLISSVLGTLALFLSLFVGGQVIHPFGRLWARSLCFISGVEVEVVGKENISPEGSQIFVANHQGFFDIFAFIGYIQAPLLWIAKESLFLIPFVGWSMKRGGHIAINRSDPREALKSLAAAVKKIKEGRSIILFPEGTRSRDGSLGPFKKGSLFIADKAKVPLVPVTFKGSLSILKKGEMTIHRGKIQIIIDKPISTEELTRNNQADFLDKVRNIIEERLKTP